MRIDKVEIINYKSFLDAQTIQFEEGFNLLLGINNAGKTSVLDVIDMVGPLGEPHRSEQTIPIYGGQTIANSEFKVTLATNFNELWYLSGPPQQIFLPVTNVNRGLEDKKNVAELERWIASGGNLFLTSSINLNEEVVSFSCGSLFHGSVSSASPNASVVSAQFQLNPDSKAIDIQISNFGGVVRQISHYAQLFKKRIYRFNALRRPGFQGGFTATSELDREAINLPYCLNHLQTSDPHGHQLLCGWINRVFPSVKWVQSTSSNSTFEVKCLPLSPEKRREDLAISMQRMGAGIGNVVAMLYVVLTSREPQVIAIDEPNAYLHPRALRELLAILEAEGKQHQFILTAHSADVLTAVNTRSISLLNFDGVVTRVQHVGTKDLHQLRSGLADLGIRMTDLHAKDRVFWVEGHTEELVMPTLLRWACPEVAAGTAVLRVERTSTFSKKKGIEPDEVAKIYERLSQSSALVPPMVCILLDGENMAVEKRKEIEKASNGQLQFLDRRMLENYLMHDAALHTVMTELGISVDIERVQAWISKVIANNDLESLDGAKALNDFFNEISEAKFDFRKTRDILTLIDWILFNDPEFLSPLRQRLRKSFGLQNLAIDSART